MAQVLGTLFIIIALIFVFTAIAGGSSKKEKKMDKNHFVIRHSKIFTGLGIICILLNGGLIVLMLISPNDTVNGGRYLIVGLFALLGVWLALYGILWKVEVIGNEIRYSGLLKRSSVVPFSMFSKIEVKYSGSEQLIFYQGNKKVLKIDSVCAGYNLLKSRLQQEGITLVKISRRKFW